MKRYQTAFIINFLKNTKINDLDLTDNTSTAIFTVSCNSVQDGQIAVS